MTDIIQALPVICQQVNLFEITSENCNNSKMTIGDRIREAREAAGYTQAQLADLINIKQQSIQQWESGDTKRPKKINEIASILGVSVDYLLNGEENIIDFPYAIAARCPLIGWADAKEWPENKSQLKQSDKLKFPTNNVVLKGDCYMLEIEDNSMVSYMEAKGFHKGKHIIISPTKKHENGNYVVAKKKNLSKLLFRQYINDGESEYLNPLNIAHYKRMDLTPEIEICGVAVAYLDILI
jgi:SOS-response transcriptional repressor LexA